MGVRRDLPLYAMAFYLATSSCGTNSGAASIDGGPSAATDGEAPESEAGDAAAPRASGHAEFSPAAVDADAGDLPNAMRGQYLWLGVPPQPKSWVDVDSYNRWNWIDIETAHKTYDWSKIDAEIAAAKARHGRFGMRIMALCQDCSTGHTYKGAQSSIPDDLADAANVLIAAAPGESTKYVIPDWNSSAYLDRLDELVNAISARYHDEPALGFLDVFSYGNWGEFHLYPFTEPGGPYATSTQKPITDDNARRIVTHMAAAFDNKLLVLNAENPAALGAAVASTSPPIGFRSDCLGSDDLAGGKDALDQVAGAADHWRTAPFISEWCQHNLGNSGANLFVQAETQVRDFHVSMLGSGNFDNPPSSSAELAAFRKANIEAGYRLRVAKVTLDADTSGAIALSSEWANDGVAPTYLTWRVVVGLKSAAGPAIEVPSTIDLRKVVPDAPLDLSENLQASAVSPGTYDVYVRVEDVQGVSLPMQLAMQGRDDNGNYALGSVAVP